MTAVRSGPSGPEVEVSPEVYTAVWASRADMAATFPPVGGVFTITTGSYYVLNSFNLNTGESITISGIVSIESNRKTIGRPTAGGADLITMGLFASLSLVGISFSVFGGSGAAVLMASNSTLRMLYATLLGPDIVGSTGVNLQVGTIDAYDSFFSGPIVQTGGIIECVNCDISSGGVHQSGSGSPTFRASQTTISGLNGFPALGVNAVSGIAKVVNCRLIAVAANNNIVNIGNASAGSASAVCISKCDLNGGQGAGGGVVGIKIDNALSNIEIDGNIFRDMITGIECVAAITPTGTVISNNRMRGPISTGIIWPVSSVPASGLLIHGNALGVTGTPITGVTSATAKVNMKCNSNNTGLLSETAIVP